MCTNNFFPEKWREAIIIPILKPNADKTNAQNYRPISLTNVLCKVVEKMVNKRLNWYLESNKILTNSQCGFRKKRSTIDQIVTLTSEIQSAFYHNQYLTAIFFDIKKAFDTTWRHHILRSLKSEGIDGNMLHFIQDFMKDRTYKVKYNGYISDRKIQKNGVPQGSTLSPTLFLLAINKITNYIPPLVQTSLFADDLVIYCRGKNITSLQQRLQQTINNLETWTQETGFCFSTTETKAIHFTKARKNYQKPKLKINSNDINFVDTIKFLGIHFDRKLSWRQHIKDLKVDCLKRMNIIKSLSNHDWGSDQQILLKIYNTLIRSKMDYASTAYSTAQAHLLKEIDTIHNTAVRLIIGAFRTSPVLSMLRSMSTSTQI